MNDSPAGQRGWWRWAAPVAILALAGGVYALIAGNWDARVSERAEQTTDDAAVKADVTPLSTKAAGLVAAVEVGDYQEVSAGKVLVRLRDEDYRAQLAQAEAGLAASRSAMVNHARQLELQEARMAQAETGIAAAEADLKAARAGIAAADAMMANARSGMAATAADVARTESERRRQEALLRSESTTRQRYELAVADAARFEAQRMSREAELASAAAQRSSREADEARARARMAASRAEVESQRRQRAVIAAQREGLRAEEAAREAAVVLARTNLEYTTIAAPAAGVVGERKVRVGQLVSPGTQVMSLVAREVWVQANFKENQMRYIREGDEATVRVDAFPGRVWTGRVGMIAPASGSQFALLPPDNATGNYTKVAQRVPVKVLLETREAGGERLRPGLSAVVTVKTRAGARR